MNERNFDSSLIKLSVQQQISQPEIKHHEVTRHENLTSEQQNLFKFLSSKLSPLLFPHSSIATYPFSIPC